MIRRPPRSTPKPSSAASDVYKRQAYESKAEYMVMFDKDFLDLRNEERRIIVNNHEIKILTLREFLKGNR